MTHWNNLFASILLIQSTHFPDFVSINTCTTVCMFTFIFHTRGTQPLPYPCDKMCLINIQSKQAMSGEAHLIPNHTKMLELKL